MLQLKSLLKQLGTSQAMLARAVDLSPATVAQIINHNHWPRSLDCAHIKHRTQMFLQRCGANDDAVNTAFDVAEEVKPRRANAEASDVPAEQNSNEDDNMLMAKQVLLPATREAFTLTRNPFGDIQSVDEIFIHNETRYIRESMYQAARFSGFLAVIGESGGGKSTLRRELFVRLEKERAPVIVIEPYVVGMEDKETTGKTLKAGHIAEAIMSAVAPLERVKSSPEARFRQIHNMLKASHAAGFQHVIIIEEAHSIPTPTLRHLKRMRDQLEVGFTPLLNVVLIGQSELAAKLSPKNGDLREVSQRVETVTLKPVPIGAVADHLAFRLATANKKLADVIDDTGVQALINRLGNSGKDGASQLYPLAIANLMTAAMNLAADLGESVVTADIVKGV